MTSVTTQCKRCGASLNNARADFCGRDCRENREVMGWARGLDSWGDETGIWHCVVSEPSKVIAGERIARAACSPRQRIAGQLERPPPGTHFCKRIGCDSRSLP